MYFIALALGYVLSIHKTKRYNDEMLWWSKWKKIYHDSKQNKKSQCVITILQFYGESSKKAKS